MAKVRKKVLKKVLKTILHNENSINVSRKDMLIALGRLEAVYMVAGYFGIEIEDGETK